MHFSHASTTLKTDLCQHMSNANYGEGKDSAEFGCRNVSVKLSRSEFHEAALKYGVLETKSSRNFMKYNDTTSISVSRSDFHGETDVTVPTTSASSASVNTAEQKSSKGKSDGYSFRNRKRALENPICTPAKRCRTLAKRNHMKPKLIVANKGVLKEGIIVLAQMRTYAAWPAKINSFGKTYINVQFFGDDTTGNVPFGNVGIFNENFQLLKFNVQKKIRGYMKAVRCAELVLNIPDHLSVMNRI